MYSNGYMFISESDCAVSPMTFLMLSCIESLITSYALPGLRFDVVVAALSAQEFSLSTGQQLFPRH